MAALMKSPSNRSMDVKIIFKPLFVMMTVFGLYFPSPEGNSTTRRRRFQMLYCFLCNAVLWSDSLRFAICFKKFQTIDEDVLLQISLLIYSVSICFLLSTFTVASSSAWPAFLSALQRLHDTYSSPKYALNGQKKLLSVIGVSTLSIFPFISAGSYNQLASEEVQSGQLCTMFPFLITYPTAYSIFAALRILGTYFMTFAFVTVELVVFSTCYILYKEFTRVGQKMRKVLSSEVDTEMSQAVESVRRQYEDVVGLLQKGNRLFSVFALVQYATSIPYVCFMVYALVKGAYSVETILFSIAGSTSLISVNIIVTCCGIFINSRAHSLVDAILQVDFTAISPTTGLSLSVFLTRLTGTNIGLSAGGLFIIDKSVFLTVAGAMVTYLVVLFQFSPSLSHHTVRIIGNITED